MLEHNGFEVVVPKQDCCGLPLQSSGLFDDARKVVLTPRPRARPRSSTDEDTIIVGNATSCTLMLKREAREILGLEDDPALRRVSERTYDICELLLELHQRGELRTDFQPLHERVAYHAPCQQQGHWIGKPALELLALIPELEVAEMNARCCGIAGTYGLKAEKYEIAMAVGSDLFDQVARLGRRRPSPATARPAAGRSRTAPSCRRCTRSTTSTGPTGSEILQSVEAGTFGALRSSRALAIGTSVRIAASPIILGLLLGHDWTAAAVVFLIAAGDRFPRRPPRSPLAGDDQARLVPGHDR